MKFSDPYWLLAGVLTCIVLVGIWRRYDVRQQAALDRFVAPHLRQRLTGSVSGVRRFLQRGLFLAATLGLFAALAGPLIGYHWEKISRRGNEVVFAILRRNCLGVKSRLLVYGCWLLVFVLRATSSS